MFTYVSKVAFSLCYMFISLCCLAERYVTALYGIYLVVDAQVRRAVILLLYVCATPTRWFKTVKQTLGSLLVSRTLHARPKHGCSCSQATDNRSRLHFAPVVCQCLTTVIFHTLDSPRELLTLLLPDWFATMLLAIVDSAALVLHILGWTDQYAAQVGKST